MSQLEQSAELPKDEANPSLWQKRRIDLLLVCVAMIWGSTFLVVKDTLQLSGPFTFLTIRFGIGFLALSIIFRERLRHIKRAELIYGLIIGLFLFATYAFQTVGLQYTTSSKSAFITGLYVPLVPLLAVFILRQRPSIGASIGVILSMLGLLLLSINQDFNLQIGWGEILVFGCAVTAAVHIIAISKFAPGVDSINLTIVQIGLTALLSLMLVPTTGEPLVLPPWQVWVSGFIMGVAATAFPLATMNRVQQFISSTRATLIYALEPVFAGIFGYFAGEILSAPGWIGCALIFLGMICGELKFSAWQLPSSKK